MDAAKKRIIIIEDEPLIKEHLKSTVKKLGYEVTGSARTEDDSIALLDKTEADVVLLDINLGGKFEGINIGAYINLQLQLPFIYVTAHSDSETLKRALHTRPSSYIVKPFKMSDIFTAIELALHSFTPEKENENDSKKDAIMIRTKGSLVKVKLSEIIYVKAEGNYSMIYTLKGKYLLRGNLMETIENNLNSDFFRIHKSFAVNIEKVNAVNQHTVTLTGQEVPLGRTYRPALLEKLSTPGKP